MSLVVLINGLPGSGKSTLARALASRMQFPMISKDTVKESLSEAVGNIAPSRELGKLASNLIWDLAALIQQPVLLESFWFRPRDREYVRQGLSRCGHKDSLEIWCEAGEGVAKKRFLTRVRHSVHEDSDRLADWQAWEQEAGPLSLGPVLTVDTGSPPQLDDIVTCIERLSSRDQT